MKIHLTDKEKLLNEDTILAAMKPAWRDGVEIAQEQEPLPRNYRDLRATIVYGMPLQVWRSPI